METQTVQKIKFIKCPDCQADILIIPDIKAMNKAINEHAKLHAGKKFKQAQLVNSLTQQLLIQIVNSDKNLGTSMPELYLLVETYYGTKRTRGIALTPHDADRWVTAQYNENPQGSYFYEKGSIYTGEL